MNTLNTVIMDHCYYTDLRLGQFFVNKYIKNPWPELYYEEDDFKAIELIEQWLDDHCYTDKEPPVVNDF